MAKDEFKQLRDEMNKFGKNLKDILGEQIRKPISAKLGYVDEDGNVFVRVPDQRTDQPNKYYFHEIGGSEFQGEAFLQPGALENWQIRFGTPIRVKRDTLSKEWEIVAIDSRYAQQYFEDVDPDEGIITNYPNLQPGLVSQTSPASMQAIVYAGHYTIGSNWYFVQSQLTQDFSESPQNLQIPDQNLRSRWVLVQITPSTGELSYKYGEIIPSSYSPFQVYNRQVNNPNGPTYLPLPDVGKFQCGYIKLTANVTAIYKDAIWNTQQYLVAPASIDETIDVLDRIITSRTGTVVVERGTGNVLYTRS